MVEFLMNVELKWIWKEAVIA